MINLKNDSKKDFFDKLGDFFKEADFLIKLSFTVNKAVIHL